METGPTRVLCIADVRGKFLLQCSGCWFAPCLLTCPFPLAGNLRSLNELAKAARANYIIHTGDFGFYDETSLERIAEKCDIPWPNSGLPSLTNI